MLKALYEEGKETELASELLQAEHHYQLVAANLRELTDKVRWTECQPGDVERLSDCLDIANRISVTDLVAAVGGIEPDHVTDALREARTRAIHAHGTMWFIATSEADVVLRREREVEAKVKVAESILPAGMLRRTDEAEVKLHGEVWVIKKGDPDPYPSHPHAHNYDEGLKLDLRNGDLYRKADFIGRWIRKKDLEKLRSAFEQRGVTMPELDLSSSVRKISNEA